MQKYLSLKMESSEEDIAKIRKTKGHCVNHNDIAADFICNKCKDVLCFMCKEDHESNMQGHRVFNYKEEGYKQKKVIVSIAEETKNEGMELEVEVENIIRNLAKNLKALIKELEQDGLKILNDLKSCTINKSIKEEQKKDKEVMESLQKKGNFLELYLFCLEVGKKQNAKKIQSESLSYEKLRAELSQIKEKVISRFSGIEKLIIDSHKSKKVGIKQDIAQYESY